MQSGRNIGTGEDISEYTFTSFTLTPGAGGEYYYVNQYSSYGGGGGGVLVNGWGPEAKQGEGKGYGGGEGGHLRDGLRGVILLEIVTE